MAPVALVTAPRAAQTMVDLNFRVARGFHINSNTPKSEYLIPTNLKMDLPTDIILGKIEYPAGQDLAFPFRPTRSSACTAETSRLPWQCIRCCRGAREICDAWCPALPGL